MLARRSRDIFLSKRKTNSTAVYTTHTERRRARRRRQQQRARTHHPPSSPRSLARSLVVVVRVESFSIINTRRSFIHSTSQRILWWFRIASHRIDDVPLRRVSAPLLSPARPRSLASRSTFIYRTNDARVTHSRLDSTRLDAFVGSFVSHSRTHSHASFPVPECNYVWGLMYLYMNSSRIFCRFMFHLPIYNYAR